MYFILTRRLQQSGSKWLTDLYSNFFFFYIFWCFRLDNTKPEVKLESEIRKSQRQIRKEKEYDINLYFPSGTPVEQIMERTLIDMILETEEKIFVGGLGALKVQPFPMRIILSSFLALFYEIDYSCNTADGRYVDLLSVLSALLLSSIVDAHL